MFVRDDYVLGRDKKPSFLVVTISRAKAGITIHNLRTRMNEVEEVLLLQSTTKLIESATWAS